MARMHERQRIPIIVVAPKHAPQTLTLNSTTLAQIQEIYRHFSRREGFPTGYCHQISPIIAKATGLTLTGGTFTLDRSTPPLTEGKNKEAGHQWLRDENDVYYDATPLQFNPGLKLHNKVRRGVYVIYPGTNLHKRYQESSQAA